jgi:hypothetical protein
MTQEDEGMLRDIFAGLAMCGWIINGNFDKEPISQLAYAMADAMMEARKPQEIGIKTVRKGKKL